MSTLYPYWIIIVLSVAFIGCSQYSSSASANANANDFTTSNSHFDPEKLFSALINNMENQNDYLNTAASFDSINSLHGADRPIPSLDFHFNFQLEMKIVIVLPSHLLYFILDFLTPSDIQNLISHRLSKAFNKSLLSHLQSKNPFPYIPIERMNSRQIDNLTIAAELINRLYPELHFMGIESVEEIGIILLLTYFKFHTATSNLFMISDKPLENFLLLFFYQSKGFSSNRSCEILKLKELILTNEYITSFDVSMQLEIITHADVYSKPFFKTLSKSQCAYIVEEMLKLLIGKPDSEKNIEFVLLQAISIDNAIFLKSFLNVFDLTEVFLKRIISVTFRNGSHKILLELFSNPFTVLFLENNPRLVALPDDYFEARHDDSHSYRFFEVYLLSQFSTRNHYPADFILRAALNKSSDVLFVGLLNNENYLIHPECLSKLIYNLNVVQSEFKHRTISVFWNTYKIYNLFCELSVDQKRVIFDQIFEEKEKSYYHLFALAECEFPYFDDFLSLSDVNVNLIEYTGNLMLESSFYKNSISENRLFLSELITMKSFTSNPQLHCGYLLAVLKYKKYHLFELMVCSESISLSFENFKEILVALYVKEIKEGHRYSYAFWMSSESIRRIFFTRFDEENRVELVKDLILSGHYLQFTHILYQLPGEEAFMVSDRFDLVDFCLKNGVDRMIIEEFIKQKGFLTRFPKSRLVLNRFRLLFRGKLQ